MGRMLNTFVTVAGVTYPPGEVSDEVAEQIDNEAVFESEDPKQPAKKAAAKRTPGK